jgi:cyclophilin family peptidyl-prolyl cis-trans isomerase
VRKPPNPAAGPPHETLENSNVTTTGRYTFLAAFLGCFALAAPAALAEDGKPRVELDTTAGKIVLELNPERAPISVENFLKYVDDGFYDGLVFHRVIKDFMIQGGGFNEKLEERADGVRAPIKNESGNGLSNTRGTIAMARTNNPNSATCQFYINHADSVFLDNAGGGYAVFGKVVEGMDVVDAIAGSQTSTRVTPKGPLENVPTKAVIIKSAKRVKS